MKKFYFHNFTDKIFTGYWNGRPYTFKAGTKKEYPRGIAEHFAKHLSNKVLTEQGKETYTSPKKPQEVKVFMDVFNKAFFVEEVDNGDNLDIVDGDSVVDEPSMNIQTIPREPVNDPYDATKGEVTGPGNKPQVIGEEEEGYSDKEE